MGGIKWWFDDISNNIDGYITSWYLYCIYIYDDIRPGYIYIYDDDDGDDDDDDDDGIYNWLVGGIKWWFNWI